MRASIPLLCAALVFAGGCSNPHWEYTRSLTRLTDEKAALIRQYRECLKRSETDASVDCFAYRTAVETFDTRSD